MKFADCILILVLSSNYVAGFAPRFGLSNSFSVRMASEADFSALEKKLAAKISQTNKPVEEKKATVKSEVKAAPVKAVPPAVKTSTPVQKKESPAVSKTISPAIVKQTTPATIKKESPAIVKKELPTVAKTELPAVVKTVSPVVVKEAVKVVAPIKTAPPAPKIAPVFVKPIVTTSTVANPPSTPALTPPDLAAGISLGLAPYLIIPAILLGSIKGLVKKPRPLPIVKAAPPKVTPYSKPIKAGVKEGIDELLSKKTTPELELDRKTLKLSVAGFALGAFFSVLSVVLSQKPAEIKESKAPTPAVKVAPIVKVAPTPIAPKVEPKPTPTPEPVAPKVEIKPVPVPAPVPAPAPILKAPEPVPVPAPAPVPVPAPAPVPVPAPAPVVKAPEPTPASETFVPATVPKGLEADKVDLDALKALRKVRK